MRSGSLAVLLSTLLLPFPLSAQKCSEQFIRSHVDNPGPELLADDVYFFSGALEKPAIGHDTEESRKTDEKIRAERKNEKHDPHKLDRVVVAASGDMAYAYGTTHLSFDNRLNLEFSPRHFHGMPQHLKRIWAACGRPSSHER